MSETFLSKKRFLIRRSAKPTPEEARRAISRVEHWYHRIEVAPGVVTPGVNDSNTALDMMEIPERLDGKRVLDVGARDGFFAFTAESRGAEVLAIDAIAPEFTGFSTAASLLGSSVAYRTMNVYDLSPKSVGTFDMIFFLGVLYHLRDPMLALDRLWEVAGPGATIWVESHVIDHNLTHPETGEQLSLGWLAPDLLGVPMAQFYPGDVLSGDGSNWWGPNLTGLQAMVESAGFETVRSRLIGSRGLVVATKVEDERKNFFREFDRGTTTGGRRRGFIPALRRGAALEIGHRASRFLRRRIGQTGLGPAFARLAGGRGSAEDQETPVAPPPKAAATPAVKQPAGGAPVELREKLAAKNQALRRLRERLAAKERELVEMRVQAATAGDGTPVAGIRPENLIWIFGVARTGSTWLSAMMADLEGHAEWPEPYVGDVFGYAYYLRAGDRMRDRKQFVLSNQYKDVWLRSIRNLVLEGANARYPEIANDGYLVIKEPNGSTGAPLLTGALPESRFILLVRDPRDVVASLLAANKKGSWAVASGAPDPGAESAPDEFVWQRANLYMQSILKAREGYENHGGPKTVVRYEDLRYNAFGELKRLYAEIGIPVEDDQLRRVVEKHDWENVPAKLKGADKPRRKAKPGGYVEDLTPEQVRIVEDVTGPILREYYPGRETSHDPSDETTSRE